MRLTVLILVPLCLIGGNLQAALEFDFDYRYDTLGFFDDPARREALEAAGRVVNRYVDNLAAIVPQGQNGWASFFDPPNGSGSIILKDLPVAADTMQIFVAGRRLPGRLAQSIDTAPVGNGASDWIDTVAYRGQAGAADDPATDFGPMGGVISFNNDPGEVPWHFDLSTRDLHVNQFDFITVAMHELLHLLGFGISVSFADHVNSAGQFIGAQSVSVGSPSNPKLELDEFDAHWKSGTKSVWNGSLQEALMAPGIFPGRRTFPSKLDRAALLDIGWEQAGAGDANRDRLFNSSDLLSVFQQGKYETGELSGWSDGDWSDNGRFESSDLVAALQAGTFENSPLMARRSQPSTEDLPAVTVSYDSQSGQLHVVTRTAPLTALQMDSAQSLFVGGTALNLDGPFDVDRPDKLFVMKLDGFSELDLGAVLPRGLSLERVRDDLTIQGAWLGGGALAESQVAVVPEPTARRLLALAVLSPAWLRRRCRLRRNYLNPHMVD
jgi:hypothetical protein